MNFWAQSFFNKFTINNLSQFIIGFLILFFILFLPKLSLADSSCSNIYGANCPSLGLSLDKKIKNPQTGELVDTLSSSGPTFLPSQEVFFRIEVKNTGNQDLQNIEVSDKLPDFVEFVSGPGSYDKNTKEITWKIDKLTPNQSRLFDIKVKLTEAKHLPKVNVTCLTNFAEAKKDNMISQDTSVFCVQTKVLGTTTELPKTGTSPIALTFFTSVAMLFLSVFLLKRTRIN